MPYRNSIIVRQDSSPEPSLSPPPSPAFDGNGIFICSAPDTPPSGTATSPSADEFETPPEESRRSSSEEAPPPSLHHPHVGDSGGPGTETPAVEADCPIMVEILSDGHVRVSEVSNVELDSFRVGEKRGLSVEEQSPSRKIRVSVDSLVITNTPNLAATEGKSEKVKVNGQIEIGVTVNMDVETEELGSGIEVTEQVIDTDAIQACNDTEEDCVNNGGTLNLQQEQEEEEEEGTEAVVDDAEDLNRQGRRTLPPSWGNQTEAKGEDKKKASNAEGASSGNVDVVMEVLRWLAEEERQKKKKEKSDHDNDAPIDFLATVRRRGVVFPEPKWWHEKEE